MKPFTTDGCSGGMSWFWHTILKHAPPWEDCCFEHDKAYWQGGSKQDRKLADQKLFNCVKNNGYPKTGKFMQYIVRVGGHPLLPVPWRWGYGYKYPRGYK